LNRLLQAKDKDAPKVIVDCEHYRSMREDRIVQRVRELAERVRITGRSLQLEPMNSTNAGLSTMPLKMIPMSRPGVRQTRPDQANHTLETSAEERGGAKRDGTKAIANDKDAGVAICLPSESKRGSSQLRWDHKLDQTVVVFSRDPHCLPVWMTRPVF
jgi:hypothetical protein